MHVLAWIKCMKGLHNWISMKWYNQNISSNPGRFISNNRSTGTFRIRFLIDLCCIWNRIIWCRFWIRALSSCTLRSRTSIGRLGRWRYCGFWWWYDNIWNIRLIRRVLTNFHLTLANLVSMTSSFNMVNFTLYKTGPVFSLITPGNHKSPWW